MEQVHSENGKSPSAVLDTVPNCITGAAYYRVIFLLMAVDCLRDEVVNKNKNAIYNVLVGTTLNRISPYDVPPLGT